MKLCGTLASRYVGVYPLNSPKIGIYGVYTPKTPNLFRVGGKEGKKITKNGIGLNIYLNLKKFIRRRGSSL